MPVRAPEIKNNQLRKKLLFSARQAGRKTVIAVLQLYYVAVDADTPKWAVAVVTAAIAYFILPFDAIVDFIPLGYTDDFAVIAAALKQVGEYLKPLHKEQAANLYERWFDKKDDL